MHLHEIIQDLEEKVAEARRIAKELPVLERKLLTARQLLAEYNGEGWSPSPEPEVDWEEMPRTRAILLVLRQSPAPLSPNEIAGILREHGREDAPNLVSASLANLKRRGYVTSPGFAQWTTSDQEPPGDARKTDLLLGLNETRG